MKRKERTSTSSMLSCDGSGYQCWDLFFRGLSPFHAIAWMVDVQLLRSVDRE